MQAHPTLYKKTSTGATQIWYVESEGPRYRTTSGQIDGKKVTSEWTVCEPKNSGRANATTPEEQCVAEVAAMYRKKLAQGGYKETLDTIDTPNYFKPMLAKEFGEHPIKWGKDRVFAQPKLDGMRCIIDSKGMWSREGKAINSAPHIFEAVKPLFDSNPTLVLDGELYNHALKDNFNAIMSLAKKQNPTPEQLDESSKVLQFHCYDLFDGSGSDVFSVRQSKLTSALAQTNPCICLVPTEGVSSAVQLDELYELYLGLGYEGQMVRLDTPYVNKRTSALLKRKEFQDAEFRIVGWEEGKGNRTGMVGCIKYALPDGRTFDSNLKGTLEYLKEVWASRDTFKRGTVQFFRYTPDGKPRFPHTTKLYTD